MIKKWLNGLVPGSWLLIFSLRINMLFIRYRSNQNKSVKKEVLKRLKHDAGNEIISVKFGSEVKSEDPIAVKKDNYPYIRLNKIC